MLVVGGGIGGLAAALAGSRSGWAVHLLEQAPEFAEVGAGVQLGPNVVRVLRSWGLEPALRFVAALPQKLEARNALTGQVQATLPLGQDMERRHGAPYVTIARADLHQLLLQAVRAQGNVALQLSTRVSTLQSDADNVRLQTAHGQTLQTPLLVGADGVWSQVRTALLNDGPPRITGHLAFRAMVPQESLPAALRSQGVTAWMGPAFHAVVYPVRAGSWLNVVCIVQGQVQDDPAGWDHGANTQELLTRLRPACSPLQDLLRAVPEWRMWSLCDRPPMVSASEQARGRVALLGDAAHPMRPYLAQGAGMAIEDAAALASVLPDSVAQVPQALQKYATLRWQRNARVQARAIRNGEIFHLGGVMQLGRDLALRTLGARLMDLHWLYAGP
jgi:salicylate hydroxylase